MMVSEIAKFISNISKGGISIFLIEQNARLVFKLSQRGYVMEKGLKVVLSRRGEDVLLQLLNHF